MKPASPHKISKSRNPLILRHSRKMVFFGFKSHYSDAKNPVKSRLRASMVNKIVNIFEHKKIALALRQGFFEERRRN